MIVVAVLMAHLIINGDIYMQELSFEQLSPVSGGIRYWVTGAAESWGLASLLMDMKDEWEEWAEEENDRLMSWDADDSQAALDNHNWGML
jgi:hypothetical protein